MCSVIVDNRGVRLCVGGKLEAIVVVCVGEKLEAQIGKVEDLFTYMYSYGTLYWKLKLVNNSFICIYNFI